MEWIAEHSDALQVVMAGVTAAVWIVYLQLFLSSYLRHRRPHILITLGAGIGLKARCFVTNLGFEPIYLNDVIVVLGTKDGEQRAVITDRSEMPPDKLKDPTDATNQGPMASGQFVDIGSFETLVERARTDGIDLHADSGVESIEIIAVAATAGRSSFVAAQRKYVVRHSDDGTLRLWPAEATARQINSYLGRRRVLRDVQAGLAE